MTVASSAHRGPRRLDVDGVACFWVPADGPVGLEVVLRAGVADETLAHRGTVRLLAEQAGARPDLPGGEAEVAVDLLLTTLRWTGHRRSSAAALAGLLEGLASPSYRRLDAVRRLPAPPTRARTGTLARLLAGRFGLVGPGLLRAPELAGRTTTVGDLAVLSRRHATRAGVALVLVGPEPRGLVAPLPDGEPAAPPLPPALPLGLPRWVPAEEEVVAVGSLLPRTAAAPVLAALLRERLGRRLRLELGVAYGATVALEPLGEDVTHLTLLAEPLPGTGTRVADEVLATLDRLAERGPTREELERVRARRLREALTPSLPTAAAGAAARGLLLGHAGVPPEDDTTALRALGPGDVRRTAGTARASALLVLPPFAAPPTGLPGPGAETFLDTPPVRRGTSWRGRSARAHLVVDPVAHGGGTVAVVDPAQPWDPTASPVLPMRDVAVVVARPSGARTLVTTAGRRLELDPAAWKHGEQAVAALDALVARTVPDEAVLRLPDGAPLPPVPTV